MCVMKLTVPAESPTLQSEPMPRTKTTTPAGTLAMRSIRIRVGACPAG